MMDSNAIDDITYLVSKQEAKEGTTNNIVGKLFENMGEEDRLAAVLEGHKVGKGNSYYDQDSDGPGIFWRPNLKKDDLDKVMAVEYGKAAGVGRGRRIAEGIETGDEVATKVARLLSKGYDPLTKERLVAATCSFHEKMSQQPEKMKDKRKPRAGYDNTFSIDKPVSALWANALINGERKQAKAIERAVLMAVRDANQYIYENGLAVTRRVTKDPITGERIEYSEPVSDFSTIDYLHSTNRNAEAQLHVHSFMPNVCVRADGSTGTISTDQIWYMKPVIDNVFKASVYARLRQIDGLSDIQFEKGQYDVKINGVDTQMIVDLSTRRQEVVAALKERGLTTKDRRAAEIAAKATRKAKDESLPVSELIGRWKEIIHSYTDRADLLTKLERADADSVPEDYETKLLRVSLQAVERLGQNETIVDERDVLAAVYRSSIGDFSLDEIPSVIQYVKSSYLVRAEYDDDGRARWGVKDLVERERSFMNMCWNLPNMNPMASQAQINAVIDRWTPPAVERGLNEEQIAGINFILKSTSAVSILEGSAGAGKSFTAGRINDVLAPAGFDVHGISASWKATDVLREDMKLSDSLAKAIAKWRADYGVGKITIGPKTIVAIDEAGMVGIRDLEFLADVVTKNGGRLILLGDTQQLSPVAAGSAMSQARRVLGSHRLNIIMRQNDPSNPERSARYREASALFVKQDKDSIHQALAIYRAEGAIQYEHDLDKTYYATADKFMQLYDSANPKETLVVTNRNRDLHAVNAEIRKAMIEHSLLGAVEVSLDSITRDNKDKDVGVELKLRAGERVIFGERLEMVKTGLPIPINNSDAATVKQVFADPEGEPVLHLVFDKEPDVVVRATPSQLVGHRAEGEKFAAKMQHAYCVTVWSSQGATVNNTIVMNANGMDYRLSYVGLTRHRHNAHVIVNAGRLEANHAVKAGVVLVDQDGKMSIPDKDDLRQDIAPEDFKFTEDDYFKCLVHEASIVENKKNFTDLGPYQRIEDLKNFLADPHWQASHRNLLADSESKIVDIQEKRILDNKARLEGKIGSSVSADGLSVPLIEGTVNPFRSIQTPSLAPTIKNLTDKQKGEATLTEEQRKAIDERVVKFKLTSRARVVAPKSSAAEPVVQSPVLAKEQPISKRISDAERDAMATRDPMDLVTSLGYHLIRSKNNQHDFCERFDGKDPIGRFSFKKHVDGGWSYLKASDASKKGVVWKFMVDYGHAISNIDAMHKLREIWKTSSLQSVTSSIKTAVEKTVSTYDAFKSKIAEQIASTSLKSTEYPKIAEAFQKAIDKGNDPNADQQTLAKAAKAKELADAGKSYHEYRFKHEMQHPWATDPYPRSRGIERETLNYFEGDVKRDVVKDHKTGNWAAGLAIAHRDYQKFGTITGYERKLPLAHSSDGNPMLTTRFTEGEGKGLGMLGQKKLREAKTIVVAESGIDGLSWWQERKLPANFKTMSSEQRANVAANVPKDTLILSTAGASSIHAMRGIELLAKANPQAAWVIASDNDAPGRTIRENVKEAVLAGNPKAAITIDVPSSILFKDWNDVACQKPRSVEDLQKTVDKLQLSDEFIRSEIAVFSKNYPTADVSAHRAVWATEMTAVKQTPKAPKEDLDFLMTADDAAVQKRIEAVSEAPRQPRAPRKSSLSAIVEARIKREQEIEKKREEEERQRNRPAVQRM